MSSTCVQGRGKQKVRVAKRLQAVEGGNSDSAGMGDAFEQQTQHMSPTHARFLAHWLHLVDLEEGDLSARRAEIWALPGDFPVHTSTDNSLAPWCSRLVLNKTCLTRCTCFAVAVKYALDLQKGCL